MEIGSYNEFCKFIKVSRETYKNFEIYHKTLCAWQEKMNLVSRISLNHSFYRHFLDSAQIYKYCYKSKGSIIDFGSGAGFPGLVLALMGVEDIHLVESNKKKCTFLSDVLTKTQTKAKIHNCRIECLPYLHPSFIISRALAPTKKLLNLCINYMLKENLNISKKDAIRNLPNLLFLKGKNYKIELQNLSFYPKINFEIKDSITSDEGKILFYKSKRIL